MQYLSLVSLTFLHGVVDVLQHMKSVLLQAKCVIHLSFVGVSGKHGVVSRV